MKKHYVYRLDNPKTGEFYFGSRTCDCNPDEDIEYKGSMVTWKPKNKKKLVKTILKSNFRKKETAIRYEAKLIKKNINDALNRNYYIPHKGFHSTGLTFKNSEKTKHKKSIAAKKRFSNPKNTTMYNKKHKDTTKAKMKEKSKGRYTLEWFILKYGEDIGVDKYDIKVKTQSKNSTGMNNGMYNRPHTIESKQKMSESSKKKVGKYNTENKLLHIYSSINEASLDNNISISIISAVCNPKRINKTGGGFIWKIEK